MRKKILALSVILLLVVSFVFGCGLVQTNYEKDMLRTIAYVGNPEVYQDEIKKYEFVSYFYASASQYLQNGKTIEETANELLDQMVSRRIVVQEIVNYLLLEFYSMNEHLRNSIVANGFTYYKITGYSDLYDKSYIDTDDEYKNFAWEKVTVNVPKERKMTLKDILAPQEDIKVKISGTRSGKEYEDELPAQSSDMLTVLLRVYYGNFSGITSTQFTSALKFVTKDFETYYKALKNSSGFYDSNGYETSSGFIEKEGFSDYLSVKSYNNVWSSEKSALDSLEAQLRKDLGLDPKEEEEETSKTTRPIPKKDPLERVFTKPAPNKNDDSYIRQEALKKYKKQIKDNQFGITYEEFFEKQLKQELEQRLLELYELTLNRKQTVEFDYFKERFNTIFNSEKQKFDLSLTDYKTALQSVDDGSFVLYNLDAGVVGYVQHILLGVDTEDNKLVNKQLNDLKSKELDRASYVNARFKILEGIKVKDLRENMEHNDYDETRFPDYPAFLGVNNDSEKYIFDYDEFYKDKFKTYFSGSLITAPGSEITGIYKTTLGQEELFKRFQQFTFMYNTDPGMFNNKTDYLLMEKNNMNAESSKFVSEFAKGARDVIELTYNARTNAVPDNDSYFYTMVATDFGWHIIMCTDIINPDKEVNLNDALNGFIAIRDKVSNDTITFADLSNPIYKLYKIIQNELSGTDYNKSLNDLVNAFYKANNGNNVVLRKDRIQDIYNLG